MKFSIITCTFNSAKYLSKNIESVCEQSFLNFEHIFIDAFSTDATVDIIKNYQKKHPDKVRFFQIKPQGISNAMNEGIKRACGDYLIHLHSDDSFYGSNVLEEVKKFLSKNNYDWIYGKINVVENDGKQVGVFPSRKLFHRNSKDWLGKVMFNFFNYIPHQSVFIKKIIFESFGFFDESLSSGMDPDFWYRIIDKTKWSFFDLIISNYCIRSDSQSASLKNKEKNKQNILKVRKRYLNSAQVLVAGFFDWVVEKKNNNYR